MLARRGLAQLAATTMPEGENRMRLNEFLLAGLLEAGVAPERAAWGIDLLLLQVTAEAAELTAWGEQGDVIAHTADTYAKASATSFPHLHELHDLVFAGTGRPARRHRPHPAAAPARAAARDSERSAWHRQASGLHQRACL
jgi:hypothetical protein